MKSLPILAVALVLAVTAAAQERTAGQANDAQVNWSALKNSIDLVSSQNQAIAATIGACGAQQKLWDGSGCVDIAFPVNKLEFVTYTSRNWPGCAGTNCKNDKVTLTHWCKQAGYTGTSGNTPNGFRSCGNDSIAHWDPASNKYVIQNACITDGVYALNLVISSA